MSTNPTIIQNIRLFLITPSPMNPRKTFNEDELKELADNIEKQGLLQPITVRPARGRNVDETNAVYEIVCGERRYRACSMLKLETIPCIVREMTDDEALDAMITENLQRRDVDPIEEAVAFNILNIRGQSVADIAERFGKSAAYVNNRMRLTSLIEPLRQALSNGQLPLGGAYLLARLNKEEQQEYFDEELDDEDIQTTLADVEYWLNTYFMELWHAPFQDGKTLKEEWNPNGKLIRRCDHCDCNTGNHGCLFADMKKEEPQCINRTCFNRKTDVYYDWFINQHASRITREGQSINPGDVVLTNAGYIMGDEEKKRLQYFTEKYGLMGYRVFTEKELPNRYYSGSSTLKEDLKKGKVVECIELADMAKRHDISIAYRYIPADKATSSPVDPNFRVSQLLERSAAVEKNAQKKITARARQAFDKEKYIARDSQLTPWELNIMAAIVFDMVPWTEQDLLIPGTRNTHATPQQINTFFNERNYSWMRRAIASFIEKEHKQPFLVELATHESAKAYADISFIRSEAHKKIDDINSKLAELGYDEKGNKL